MSIVKFHRIVELINIFLPYYVVMHHIYVWHHYLEFDFVRDLNHKVSNSKKNIQNIKLVDNIYVLYGYAKDAHERADEDLETKRIFSTSSYPHLHFAPSSARSCASFVVRIFRIPSINTRGTYEKLIDKYENKYTQILSHMSTREELHKLRLFKKQFTQ